MDEHSHTEPPSEPTLRIRALESLLVEKGLVDPGAVDEIIELFEKRIGPRNGAKVASHSPSRPTGYRRDAVFSSQTAHFFSKSFARIATLQLRQWYSQP